jgi:hypothetical protein
MWARLFGEAWWGCGGTEAAIRHQQRRHEAVMTKSTPHQW